MKIEADDKEIQDIFSLGYFKIPRFQRPYSWEIDEVESFWNDIINEGEENYFIGSMVVYQTRRPYFGIVDGQQRLTTITLLLSAIRNGFITLGEDNLAKGVHKYVEKANIDNEDEYIIKAETSFPYLQSHIQSYDGFKVRCEVGSEEKKLEVAFELLNEKLEELIPALAKTDSVQQSLFTNHESDPILALKELRDRVLSLKLVFIQLDNEEDAYLIFETLNARGRDLTTSDLIKNLILKKLKSNSVALDAAKESWNGLVKQFDEINDGTVLDSFLLHFWLSKYGYITDKKLFSEVKSYIGHDENKAKQLIEELRDSSQIYTKAVDPLSARWQKNDSEIRDLLLLLKSFKVKQQSAMVLALLRARDSGRVSHKNLKNYLHKIVCFHYAFNSITSQRSSGSISTNYSRIAILLSHAEDNDKIQKAFNELNIFLRSKFPAKDEFVVKFLDLEYLSNRTKYKPAIVHALKTIMADSDNGLTIDYQNLTIEHLIPQSFDSTNDEIIGSIGNLILVDRKTNSEELRDLNPSSKIRLLKEKGFPLGNSFINSEEFDEQSVKERSRKIASVVYDKLQKVIFNNR